MVTQSVDVLTAPLVEDSTTRDGYVGPKTPVETALAGVLAEILLVERVSVDDHFFDDLGADSLVMAQFCARVRKRPDLPSVSIKDIYQHPTISSLSLGVGARGRRAAHSRPGDPGRGAGRCFGCRVGVGG